MFERNSWPVHAAVTCLCLLPLADCYGQAETPKTPAIALNSLAWLSGKWTGVAEGTKMEEFWLAPEGQIMVGLHRDIFPSGEAFFEFLRIINTTDGLTFFASPKGRPPTPFKAVDVGERHVVFENKQHDFPQRISYRLGEQGNLHARIEGTVDGKLKFRGWQWQRASCTGK